MEMEAYFGKGDLEVQAVQDQAVLYQLRRSSHKIEELMDEVSRLRKDNSTQLCIITALQQQLRAVDTARRDLQDQVLTLRQEIQRYQAQIQIFKQDDELSNLQTALRILKKRYSNCQEENKILRADIIEKENQIQKTNNNNRLLADQIQRLNIQVSTLNGELQLASSGLSDLRKLNSQLQRCRDESENKYRQMMLVLSDYESRFGHLDRDLRQSLRAEEGWFCQFKDLRETVQHIEQLRQNMRLKKLAKLSVS